MTITNPGRCARNGCTQTATVRVDFARYGMSPRDKYCGTHGEWYVRAVPGTHVYPLDWKRR